MSRDTRKPYFGFSNLQAGALNPRPPTLQKNSSAAAQAFVSNVHAKFRGAARMGNSERHFDPSLGDQARVFFDRLKQLLRDEKTWIGLSNSFGGLLMFVAYVVTL